MYVRMHAGKYVYIHIYTLIYALCTARTHTHTHTDTHSQQQQQQTERLRIHEGHLEDSSVRVVRVCLAYSISQVQVLHIRTHIRNYAELIGPTFRSAGGVD